MRGSFASLLQRLRLHRPTNASGDSASNSLAHAPPRIEAGSTLHTMAGLDPVAAVAFADAFVVEIEHAIATCTLGDADTPQGQALLQIHSLKNTISLTGSQQLLKACDQLRDAVSHHAPGDTLAQRFTAVANAAGLLVKYYRRTLPSDNADPHA
ncbi:hypothetical protein [Xanthomonas vasicola]|uniref:hypothetical protein n=1 Tax=Xanthomonas vasicola TaxID=56459 RepID=UPI00034AF37D|nr:hypothetical protein [Xanthomonas vasicola]MBV7303866.1 hypothetical protein [Xanthomonas vasicola pv. vasculorum]AZR28247.1 hypothetical protein NX80_019325 [Xanthomonas vasicola pv. arecae]KEZ95949.1 hypothetical protein A11M_0118025 [Xanthomonas vasicola pv. vasculorum NCPPB 895]KFA35824.1 hypothetical protein KWI_0111965 [Xanthomonas vasicola pv. vasculorum NCPPB 206]MDO6935188.1 hypothetical protein [Xanthomonas vasicola]